MSIDATLTLTFNDGATVQKAVTITNDAIDKVDVTVAQSTTQEITVAFTLAGLECFYLLSDKGFTLKTNSSGSPDNTFTIAANKPMAWYKGSGIPNPFTTAVTSLFVVNGGGGAAAIKLRVSRDATP